MNAHDAPTIRYGDSTIRAGNATVASQPPTNVHELVVVMRQFAKLRHQISLSLRPLTKSVMPSKSKAAAKSKQSPDPLARLSPVPSPVKSPVVSDDIQFNLKISNLKSLDIIHDALH